MELQILAKKICVKKTVFLLTFMVQQNTHSTLVVRQKRKSGG